MFHTPCPPRSGRMQRSHGEAALCLDRGRLGRLRQQGSAKAFLPAIADVPEVVFLNTSGGLTSGDTLAYRVDLAAGTRAIATTQTAERAYRAEAGPAHVTVAHHVGAGGWIDWLPQETILFQGSDLRRETSVALEADAGCVMLEALVLGRAAMGEEVTQLRLSDRRRITRAGRPVYLEPLALDSAGRDRSHQPALLGPARALASLVMCAQAAQDALAAVRARLGMAGVEGAASGFDGKLVVRLLAGDGWPLRRQILALLDVLRRGAPPPRVWQI